MACPSGCVNGGGQIRLSSDERETPTETRQRVAATLEWFQQAPDYNLASSGRSIGECQPQQPLLTMHTRYHVVPPMQHALGAAAGVAVADTQW
jgi:hypothetical protein